MKKQNKIIAGVVTIALLVGAGYFFSNQDHLQGFMVKNAHFKEYKGSSSKTKSEKETSKYTTKEANSYNLTNSISNIAFVDICGNTSIFSSLRNGQNNMAILSIEADVNNSQNITINEIQLSASIDSANTYSSSPDVVDDDDFWFKRIDGGTNKAYETENLDQNGDSPTYVGNLTFSTQSDLSSDAEIAPGDTACFVLQGELFDLDSEAGGYGSSEIILSSIKLNSWTLPRIYNLVGPTISE